jgi:hypothetical protein
VAQEIAALNARGLDLDRVVSATNYASSRAISAAAAEDIAVPSGCQTGRGIVVIGVDALCLVRMDGTAPAALADVDDGTSGMPLVPGVRYGYSIPQGCAALKLRAGAANANVIAAFYVSS